MKEGKVQGVYGTMFYITNMKKTLDFYRDALGFTEEINESPDWSEINVQGQKICFHVTDDANLVEKGGIMIVQVQNLRAIAAGLKARKVEILSDVKEVHPGAFALELIDNNGNALSLYEHTGA